MGTYIVRQTLYALLIVLGVLTVTFLLIRVLPGDPTRIALGQRADAQAQEALRKAWKLDQPIYIQYADYVARAASGDLGRSFTTNRPVMESLLERLPRTAILALSAMILGALLGTAIGIVSATRPRTPFDNTSMVFALLGISVPVFVLGAVLQSIFSANLHWFDVRGYIFYRGDLHLNRIVLPLIALAARPLSIFARITRSSMLETLGQDYVRTARAKGLSERVTVFRHALRNALNPVVTTISAWFAATLAGTFFIELIFDWPGMGLFAFQAVLANDYPIIQGVVILTATIFVAINLIVDIIYSLIDPRVRLA